MNTSSLPRVGIVIPTLNARAHLAVSIPALTAQRVPLDSILVIDSSSDDDTVAMARKAGMRVEVIARSAFNHGGTRAYGASLMRDHAILVFMTQDAIPATPDSIARLVAAFTDPQVALAYGRQLPRPEAGAVERHARIFNYPPRSERRNLQLRERLGIKTLFCSDSFAAYRTSSLMEVGNFPQDAFFAEDQIVADRMLAMGWDIAYMADAKVYHSHDYTIAQEFRRYFDVGVFHARNSQLLIRYGRAEREGGRFIRSELGYLLRHAPFEIPEALLRNAAKYLGYRAGAAESILPRSWHAKLSMQPFYWRARQD